MKKNGKAIKLSAQAYNELRIIVAETNAAGIASYMEDLFTAWVNHHDSGEGFIPMQKPVRTADDEVISTSPRLSEELQRNLRIFAARNGMSLKAYIEAIIEWVAARHVDSGAVWFDESPAHSISIRTRN